MAVTFLLDRRRAKKDNTYPLKLNIYVFSANISLNTGVNICANQWDGKAVIRHPHAKKYNLLLASRKAKIESFLIELSYQDIPVSSKELKRKIDFLLKRSTINSDVVTTANEFVEYYRKVIQKKVKYRTKELYKYTFAKICEFEKDIDNFSFEKLDKEWLYNFDMYLMEKGLSVNSRAIDMRNIRCVYNAAIDDDVVSLSSYPFRKFQIKKEETFKRSLPVEDLRNIKSVDLEPYLIPYRDIFMLGFYLIGINLIDLVNLKHESIVSGRLEYRREKTGRLYSIKLEPEAMELIEKYKGEKNLLNIMDRYQDYRNYTYRIDKNLKKIQNKLTTYWARHTWATFAAELDIPKETIAAALGHGSTSTTDIYINFNHKKVDEANRKVIDYLNE